MKRLSILVALGLAGCSKTTTVKQCEELVSLGDKIGACATLPEASRTSIKSSMETMRNALKALDGAGGKVNQDQLDSLGLTCQRQLDQIRKVYEKTAPECLK
jgi:hypothetical protein